MIQRKGIIKMSTEEARRVGIIQQVTGRIINQQKAAELIGVTDRQVRRLIKRYKEEGIQGVVHRSRGMPGNRGISCEVKEQIVDICKEKYYDFGPTFAAEKLYEIEGNKIDHETLRKWLLPTVGSSYWRRKKRPHKQRRERKAHNGEMVQMDGSHHDWLEDRGPRVVLMGYIDDATNTVYAKFYEYEGTEPAFDGLWGYIERHGIPQIVYLDNHTTYKSPKGQTIHEELLNKKSLSQFERAMEELGVRVIHAGSPEAKGRVERLFRTFQDRLVKELRLAGICTLEAANTFLEGYLAKHNKKFSRVARCAGDLHIAVPSEERLARILCIKENRKIQKDSTIRYKKRIYLLMKSAWRCMKQVTVEERLDGSVHICYGSEYLEYKEIEPSIRLDVKEVQPVRKDTRKKKGLKTPSKNHPWRQRMYSNYALIKK
ncbi:ISNCY family transposase [Chlamydiota bacterium]